MREPETNPVGRRPVRTTETNRRLFKAGRKNRIDYPVRISSPSDIRRDLDMGADRLYPIPKELLRREST